MKKSVFILLAFCMITFTSCIDILEEMFLNKDGSGKYVISMDMSALMENGGIRDLLGSLGEEDAADQLPTEKMEMDSIIHMKNAPADIRANFDKPEILDKITIHTQMSESKEIFKMTFAIDFANLGEVDYFLNNLDKLQGDNPMGNESAGLLPKGKLNQKLFDLSKRTFTRFASAAPTLDENDENMAMAKMMFADAKYKTVYHLPGKIKSTTIPNAVVDGKTITINSSVTDVMDGKVKMEGLIKFKRK